MEPGWLGANVRSGSTEDGREGEPRGGEARHDAHRQGALASCLVRIDLDPFAVLELRGAIFVHGDAESGHPRRPSEASTGEDHEERDDRDGDVGGRPGTERPPGETDIRRELGPGPYVDDLRPRHAEKAMPLALVRDDEEPLVDVK